MFLFRNMLNPFREAIMVVIHLFGIHIEAQIGREAPPTTTMGSFLTFKRQAELHFALETLSKAIGYLLEW